MTQSEFVNSLIASGLLSVSLEESRHWTGEYETRIGKIIHYPDGILFRGKTELLIQVNEYAFLTIFHSQMDFEKIIEDYIAL
jgi:hypothetical protein